MNAFLYLLALLAALYGIVSAIMGAQDGLRRPRDVSSPPPPPRVEPGWAPVIEIEVGTKGSSTGTAFAITNDGWWLTARHVAHGCDAIWLQTGPRKGLRVQDVKLHPNADLALLRTKTGRAPLRLSNTTPGRGDDGYSLGYPQGRPGDVHARAIGQARMKSVGRYHINEPILAWAEIKRRPHDLPALGGLSGGPMIDGHGRVTGVLVASSKRRGRVMTTAQSSIRELLAQVPELRNKSSVGHHRLSSKNFTSRGKALRQTLTITKVICKVSKTHRRPRR